MRLKPVPVDIHADWEDHHSLGQIHRIYVQAICREAEVGLLEHRLAEQRGFEAGSVLVERVRERLLANGFQVEECVGPGSEGLRVFLAVSHPEAAGAELAALAAGAMEQP